MTKVAVVGHVEHVQFICVARLPAAGEVIGGEDAGTRAAGGAAVAAVALARLGAEVDLFCALGSDGAGESAISELSGLGIAVHAARRAGPTRRVVTLLERGGERTIVTLGERLAPRGADRLPWQRLDAAAGAYLTAGDPGAVRNARRAGVLVATPRIREGLASAEAPVDALVFSDRDRDERQWAASLADRARLMVATDGERGGRWWGETEGHWKAVDPPGPAQDSYGCGDAFAAGLTFGLASGRGMAEAAALGARCGAEMLARIGAP